MKFIMVAKPLSTPGAMSVETMYADYEDEEELAQRLARRYEDSIYFFVETYNFDPVVVGPHFVGDIDGQQLVLIRRQLWRYSRFDKTDSYAENGWPHDIYYDVIGMRYLVADFPKEGNWVELLQPLPESMDDFIIETPGSFQIAAGVVTSRFRVRMEK